MKNSQVLEAIVVAAALLAGGILAASRFGYLPADVSGPAFIVVLLCLVLEGGWKLFGQGLWRQAVVKGWIQRDLEIASREMGQLTGCEIRACLMQPKGMFRKILRVASSSQNMYSDRDRGVRLERWQGCAGKSWGHGKPVLAHLTLPSQDGGPDWSMTPDLIDLTRDIKSVLSYPVFVPENGSTLHGILNFDAKVGVATKVGGPEGLNLADRHARTISAIMQATQ